MDKVRGSRCVTEDRVAGVWMKTEVAGEWMKTEVAGVWMKTEVAGATHDFV